METSKAVNPDLNHYIGCKPVIEGSRSVIFILEIILLLTLLFSSKYIWLYLTACITSTVIITMSAVITLNSCQKYSQKLIKDKAQKQVIQ